MSKYPFNYLDYQVDREAKIATVTLNNPKQGNCAPSFAEEMLADLIDEWESDDDVKVVIFKGAGSQFCAGHDIQQYNSTLKVGKNSRHNLRDSLVAQRNLRVPLRRLMYSLKPTIAQVHGLCIEFGNVLQACTDITIASHNASFGNLGQTAGISGITIIRLYIHLIGYKRMREMMIAGRTINGREASKIGLINRSVPAEKLDAEVLNEARRIALLPLDGIVAGKAYSHQVYESMGFSQAFTENAYFHTLGLKLKFEEDEPAFFREAQKKGVGAAAKDRALRYDPLGGFGPKDERPTIVE